jgi:hypothetical protein
MMDCRQQTGGSVVGSVQGELAFVKVKRIGGVSAVLNTTITRQHTVKLALLSAVPYIGSSGVEMADSADMSSSGVEDAMETAEPQGFASVHGWDSEQHTTKRNWTKDETKKFLDTVRPEVDEKSATLEKTAALQKRLDLEEHKRRHTELKQLGVLHWDPDEDALISRVLNSF